MCTGTSCRWMRSARSFLGCLPYIAWCNIQASYEYIMWLPLPVVSLAAANSNEQLSRNCVRSMDLKANEAVITRSELEILLDEQAPGAESAHPDYLHELALQILHNLKYQHRWTDVRIHVNSSLRPEPLPRPLISGYPPKRLYIQPDEQVELLKAEQQKPQDSTNENSDSAEGHQTLNSFESPEEEWVLPSHLREKWSLRQFAEIFDSIQVDPSSDSPNGSANKWRMHKRVVLATLQDDSTVVYYIMHDGIVKPRQN